MSGSWGEREGKTRQIQSQARQLQITKGKWEIPRHPPATTLAGFQRRETGTACCSEGGRLWRTRHLIRRHRTSCDHHTLPVGALEISTRSDVSWPPYVPRQERTIMVRCESTKVHDYRSKSTYVYTMNSRFPAELTIIAHSTIGAPTQNDSRSARQENREDGTYPCSLRGRNDNNSNNQRQRVGNTTSLTIGK